MKKSIFTAAFLLGSLLVVGCNNPETGNSNSNNQINNNQVATVDDTSKDKSTDNTSTDNSSKENKNRNNNTPEKVSNNKTNNNKTNNNKTIKAGAGQPNIGTIKEIVQGDLLCYVTLVDEKGKEQTVGASFDVCASDKKFLNKKVKLSYKVANVNDCQSNEPCGKTKKESIISQIDIIDDSTTSNKSYKDSVTLSNGKWTIKLSNYNSWDGVNGNGNVKYYGCDDKGQCINLSGGKIFCRNGKCVTRWINGEYVYSIQENIVENASTSELSTLVVNKGKKVLLRVDDLKTI